MSAPLQQRVAEALDAQWQRKPAAWIALQLPFPPSVNHYWRSAVVRGHVVVLISEAGRRYRREVLQRCMVADCMHRMRGRLRVTLDAHAPTARLYDIDNLPKSVLDALTSAHVWVDDSQVDELIVRRQAVAKGGVLGVLIESLA